MRVLLVHRTPPGAAVSNASCGRSWLYYMTERGQEAALLSADDRQSRRSHWIFGFERSGVAARGDRSAAKLDRLDVLHRNAQLQPPDVQPAQASGSDGGERRTVV